MRRWLILCIFLSFSLTGSVSAETEPVSFPEIPSIAQAPSWRRLLFYGRNALGKHRGVMDGPGFYLSASGKTNPESELRAFLVALRTPPSATHPDNHAACRFPARTAWVREHLPTFSFPPASCPAWETFQASHVYRGASLVFSSYYVEHPSSLFGHTFLALHKKDNPAPLLDDALNYGAVPDTDNPLLYAWLGLVGGFPGSFQMMPYYVKVQEYAHSEHRDLWSYQLGLSSAEMRDLTKVIWEAGGTSADYYFFDENCSALILYLLAAVSPRVPAPGYVFWMIPSDAIRTLVKSGLVTETQGTASSLGRFLARHETLSDADQEIFHLWTKMQPEPLEEPEREARLLDTYLDYKDYREKVAADWDAGAWEKPRRDLLKRRAALKVRKPQVEPHPPAYLAPHRGHDSSRVGFGLGRDQSDTFVSLHGRFALHDLLNRPDGYHEGLAVEGSALRLDARPGGQVILRDYKLVNVLSLPRLPLLIQPLAWDFTLGWRRRENTGESYVRYAVGWNFPWRNSLDVFALGRAEVGSSRREPFASAAPMLGVRVRAFNGFTLFATAARSHRILRKSIYGWENEGSVAASWAVGDQWDLRFEAKKDGPRKEAAAVLYHTF